MHKGVILSIDDDRDLQTVTTRYLEDDGYSVIHGYNFKSALEKLDTASFDVVLLDLILPDGEGMELIPRLRAKSPAAIIVVSGKSDTMEKIVCLELGADDYMTKPFEMRELSARIKAILRRSDNGETGEQKASLQKSQKIKFRGWCLDRTQYQLFDEKQASADLTTGEFRLLEALVLSPNRALSREHLFDLTREGNYESYDRAIDIQIARLRKKLRKDGKLIKTVRSIGYMFNADIEAA